MAVISLIAVLLLNSDLLLAADSINPATNQAAISDNGNYCSLVNQWLSGNVKVNADAAKDLGISYKKGECGLDVNYGEAYKWYKVAYDLGYEDIANNIAGLYMTGGNGLPQDTKIGTQWLITSYSKDKSARTAFNIGLAYESGGPNLLQDYSEAVKWWKIAAGKGHLTAQNNLGYLYLNGKGVKINEKESFKYFSMAASQGDTGGICNLANLYATGRGTKKNLKKAKELAKKGFDAGEEYCKVVWDHYDLANK